MPGLQVVVWRASRDICIRNAAVLRNKCIAGTEWIPWLSGAGASLFAALAVLRIIHLFRRQTIVRAPVGLFILKLLTGAVFIGIRIGQLENLQPSTNHSMLPFCSALDVVASCLLLILVSLEHYKSSRPSTLTCLFLCLGILLSFARWLLLETDWVHETGYPAPLSVAAIFTQFAFLWLESLGRRRWLAWHAENHSPEETSSILSLGFYSWLNSLLWKGYHEPLHMSHLFPLDQSISVKTLGASKKSTGTSTWQLIMWLATPLGKAVLLPIVPRLCLLGFTFCQPFMLQRILLFLSSQTQTSSTSSDLIAVAAFTYLGIAFSTGLYWYYQERFQTLTRAFLVSSVYRKINDMPHVGDGDAAPVTLIGADVDRIYVGLRNMHELWANMIQIALASWLLQQQLGLAFVAPLVLVLLGFGASFTLSRYTVRFQSAWMSRVQSRTSVTSAILSRIKDLRVTGMTNIAADLLQREREDEIDVGESSRVLLGLSASLSQIPNALAPALAFAFGPHALDETRAYTALSSLALLTGPLMVVLQSLPIIAASFACLRRIKVFLETEGRQDRRQIAGTSNLDGAMPGPESNIHAAVAIQNGSFGWVAGSRVLSGVNLKLPKASITFVTGPVASGKSTLCRALLGEVSHTQGTIKLSSHKIAYCDQTPFLFNASIKESVIGFAPFDAARYAEAIHATMLEEDLARFPAGDQTIIGPKGISLSGGQRQRVSLARALYHDADLLVLDDVFSGLDIDTQQTICHRIFGRDGLLRSRSSTAIVCTHAMELLFFADHVVSLSSQGTILSQRPGGHSKGEQNVRPAAPKQTTDEPDIAPSKMISPPTQGQSTPSPGVDMDVYRHWLATIGVIPILVYLILIAGNGFFSNYPNIWLKLWAKDSVSQIPQHSFAYWIGIYAMFGFCMVICVFSAGLIMLHTGVRLAGISLHHTTVQTVMHSSLWFLTITDQGKILNLFSQDMNIMDTQLPRMVNNLCFCLANALGQAAVMALSSVWLVVSYPFFATVLWVVQRIYLPSSKRLRLLDLEAKTPLYTSFIDTVSGLPTIRSFGWFPDYLSRTNALLDDSQRPLYLLAMAQQWLMLTMNMLVAVMAVILVALATRLGSNAGNVGAGLITIISLGSTLSTIVVAYTGLETSLGAISRLKSFADETEIETKTGDEVVPDKDWPRSGRIRFNNVDASYNGTDIVLHHVTLDIDAGDKVAICGRTGSGKSSILALLLRLINPLTLDESGDATTSPGVILIDNVPLHTIDQTFLREHIICTSQDAVFLPDGTSLHASLDPWSSATDDECMGAIEAVGLTMVVQQKGGLHAPVIAAELSAGQKQLFHLARAVLRRRVKLRETGVDGGVLLLDEITSNADEDLEQLILKVLNDEFAAYTVICVTHRRAMMLACDRTIVIDAGRVVEDRKSQ